MKAASQAALRMKRFFFVTCLLTISAGTASSASGTGISTAVVFSKTRFLSTEDATATLSITNDTASAISFDTGVALLVRSGTQWKEYLQLRTISHVEAAPSIQIAPSERYTMAFRLPSCRVYSDPCTEDVIARYTIVVGGAAKQYETAIPRYEFVPDPTATYDIPGLSGNRPTFIAPGIAHDTVFPDRLMIEFTASSSEVHPPFTKSPALVNELAQAFSDAGVTMGQPALTLTETPGKHSCT